MALVRAERAALEPRPHPLGARTARGVRSLAAARRRARRPARGAPRDRRAHPVRAGRLDHRARQRARADRRRQLPQPRRDGRRDGARRDRRSLHDRERLAGDRRESPLRRSDPPGHMAGLHDQGTDPDRGELLARGQRRRDDRRDDRRALRDRREQRRHPRHPCLLDRRRRSGQGAEVDRPRPTPVSRGGSGRSGSRSARRSRR